MEVILYNNSTKLPSLKWTQMVRNGKFSEGLKKVMESHVKERKNGVDFRIFLSPQVTKPPYYAKLLLTHQPWIKNKSPSLIPSHWIKLLYESTQD
ncbi:hypothetical protein QL285_052494 [Trifolium repens]|nr:hypothetical protein QL285_052494 [Trifolium repens]